jgi:hypothetical protein
MVLHYNRFIRVKTTLKLIDNQIGNRRNPIAEMNQPADAGTVLDGSHAVCQNTADKDITRKQRFDYAGHASARHFLDSKSGEKNFQTKVLTNIGSCNVFVFRLRPRAIPSWGWQMHFWALISGF